MRTTATYVTSAAPHMPATTSATGVPAATSSAVLRVSRVRRESQYKCRCRNKEEAIEKARFV
jgi:hypothetical protein